VRFQGGGPNGSSERLYLAGSVGSDSTGAFENRRGRIGLCDLISYYFIN
jgi:hypothetical protein